MRTSIKLAILVLTLQCVFFDAQAQQAWTRQKGQFYKQVGVSMLYYNSYIDAQTKSVLPLNRKLIDGTLGLYGEYGLTDFLTVSGYVPVKFESSFDGTDNFVENGSIFGLSNVQLALTGRLVQHGGFVLSAKTKVGLPTASYQANTGLRTGFDATIFTPSLLAGLGTSAFFTSVEFGREMRNNGYSDRNFAAWQIGRFFSEKKYLLILNVEYLKTIAASSYPDGNSTFTAFYLSTQSYVSPSIKFGYYLKPNNILWFSAGFALPGTDDVAASPGITISYSSTNF